MYLVQMPIRTSSRSLFSRGIDKRAGTHFVSSRWNSIRSGL